MPEWAGASARKRPGSLAVTGDRNTTTAIPIGLELATEASRATTGSSVDCSDDVASVEIAKSHGSVAEKARTMRFSRRGSGRFLGERVDPRLIVGGRA